MPEVGVDHLPRHRLPAEMKALTSVFAALNTVKFDDLELARFDRLSEYARQHGCDLKAASEAISEPVTWQAIAIVASGLVLKWYEGGDEAALVLPASEDEFNVQVKTSASAHCDLVRIGVSSLGNLAWARVTGDDERLRSAGKSLLKLAGKILGADSTGREMGLELALASHDLLAPLGDPEARDAQNFAYRLLVWSKRLPFLADLAPCKFPPPILPTFPSETLLTLCLEFIERGILDQPIDLGEAARDMLDDSESVIWNEVVAQIGEKTARLKLEIALGPALLSWAFDHDSEESKMFGVDVNIKLRALLKLLCKNRVLLERHRDDDLSDIYTSAYLGANPSARKMGLAIMIETINQIVKCVVGLSEDDARAKSSRNVIFPPREVELIQHLKATIARGSS